MKQKSNSNQVNLIIVTALIAAILSFGQLHAQVKSDYDKTVDFSTIKTYTFKGWAKDSEKVLNDIDQKRLTDAFAHELSIRGLKMQESGANVEITLFVVIDNKTSTTAYTTYNGGMGYGPGRWGYGAGMGMGTATTSVSEHDYQEGTIVINFYSTSTKKLIWQGINTKTVKDNPEKRDKTIPKNVSKLMKKYPVKPTK